MNGIGLTAALTSDATRLRVNGDSLRVTSVDATMVRRLESAFGGSVSTLRMSPRVLVWEVCGRAAHSAMSALSPWPR